GLRYRVDFPPLPDHPRLRADLVFSRVRVAVFIDGCYWHGCPAHYRPANRNAEFWSKKIAANVERDTRTNETLLAAEWTVLRFWEHADPKNIATEILQAVRNRSRP